jgi:hypothetical protein
VKRVVRKEEVERVKERVKSKRVEREKGWVEE